MDNQTLLIVLTIFVAVAAIALLIQMGTMLALYLAVRKMQTQVMSIWPEVEKIIGVTRRITENVEKQVEKIGATSSEILATTKQQVHKIDELLNDATTRAKVQIERAEMVLDDTMGRAQETVSILQRTVLRPIRELNGLMAGIRTSIAYLGRGSRPTVDHATSDEEMFI
jgi:uncharacterized protein with PIN domain